MHLKFLSWREGKYADLWFSVHFMTVVFGGTLFYLTGVPRDTAWTVCVAVAIAWEFIEKYFRVPESLQNKLLDILTAIIGGYIGYEFIPSLHLQFSTYVFICMIEGLFFLTLTITGWMRYKIIR